MDGGKGKGVALETIDKERVMAARALISFRKNSSDGRGLLGAGEVKSERRESACYQLSFFGFLFFLLFQLQADLLQLLSQFVLGGGRLKQVFHVPLFKHLFKILLLKMPAKNDFRKKLRKLS